MKINHQIISLIQNGYLDICNNPPMQVSDELKSVLKMVLVPADNCALSTEVDNQPENEWVTHICLTTDNYARIFTNSGINYRVQLHGESSFSLRLFTNQDIPKMKYTLVNAIDQLADAKILTKSATTGSYEVADGYMITYGSDQTPISGIHLSTYMKQIEIWNQNKNDSTHSFDSELVLTVWNKYDGLFDNMKH